MVLRRTVEPMLMRLPGKVLWRYLDLPRYLFVSGMDLHQILNMGPCVFDFKVNQLKCRCQSMSRSMYSC